MLGDAEHLGDRPWRQPRLAAPSLGDHANSVDALGREAGSPATHRIGIDMRAAGNLLVANTYCRPQQGPRLDDLPMGE